MHSPLQQRLPEEFAEPLRRASGRLGPLASRVVWYSEITSTNDVAVRLAEGGAAEGLLVAAETQTAGRGRHGRTWSSPPGAGIYATVLFRPGVPVIPLMTIAAGVAIADGIELISGLPVAVKWPNDIFVCTHAGVRPGRKLAGILAEGGRSPDGAPWVVLGFGINVLPGAYPPDVATAAASLAGELGRPVDRGELLAECLASLWRRYCDLGESAAGQVLSAWRARAAPTLGRRVEWESEGRAFEGVAQDIDDAGALLVRTRQGIERVCAGELRWT